MARIGIHQPNFFPHLSFFEKMKECDKFVIMVNCQWEKNGYQNRFFLDRWHTMSVNGGLMDIVSKTYMNPYKDWRRIKERLMGFNLSQFDSCIGGVLWKTNFEIIEKIKDILSIDTELVLDYKTELRGTERLVDICKRYGAKEYFSGPSGNKYLDVSLFDKAGIKVSFQKKTETKPIINYL